MTPDRIGEQRSDAIVSSSAGALQAGPPIRAPRAEFTARQTADELASNLPQDYRDRLWAVKSRTRDIFKTRLMPWFPKHGIEHAENVLFHAEHILGILDGHVQLDDDELYSLCVAAYVHDVGMELHPDIDKREYNQEKVHYGEWVAAIRSTHANRAYEIISGRHDEWSCEYIGLAENDLCGRLIARIVRGHSGTTNFQQVRSQFKESPCSPGNVDVRGLLLSAVFRVADELDLHRSRVSMELMVRQPNLPVDSKIHWHKHDFIEKVDSRNGEVRIRYCFHEDMTDEACRLFRDFTEYKLRTELLRVHQIPRDELKGEVRLFFDPEHNVEEQLDSQPSPFPPYLVDRLRELANDERIKYENQQEYGEMENETRR